MEMDEEYYSGGSGTPRRQPQSGNSKHQPPQETVRQFWEHFNTKHPGKVFTVLPDNPYARTKASKIHTGVATAHEAVKSYEQAKSECEEAVRRIVRECYRVNKKYTDPHFDIEFDLKYRRRDYLDGLDKENYELRPKGVKRVTDIFENPQFFMNGPSAGDVRQGRDGDCWLMAALCTLGNKEELINRLCVARDEKIGVYGFVFYRDGEWQQCIVDDKLYLRAADYDESIDERPIWDDITRKDTEEEYRKVWQTGSRALYFAQCSDENETWLPLLEKAYAKAHGDYSAIEGGFVGEAIEDLTGGVTSEILSTDILDRDHFWTEELMKVNQDFLFGCATGLFSNWLDPKYTGPARDRRGIDEGHSYSIMDAKEIDGVRLLKVRNPWGKKEWSGAWSDGSEEWTPQWMERLGHKFGNDGMFWISYDDLLKKYQHLDRTRLFGPEWNITQQWTSLNVPWSADYHHTRFIIDLSKTSPVVVVLSQLDTRYFRGLEGEYNFTLQFRLQKEGEDDYIVRSRQSYVMSRSVSTELTLERGRYAVLVKVTAFRRSNGENPANVIKKNATTRREKLVQIGLSYDLANTKGLIVETEQEQREREMQACRARVADRMKLREETVRQKQKQWIRNKKLAARESRLAEKRANAARKRQTQQQLHTNGFPDGILPDDLPCTEEPSEQVPIRSINVSTDTISSSSISGSGSSRQSSTSTNSTPKTSFSSTRSRTSSRPYRPRINTGVTSSSYKAIEDQALLEDFEFDSDLDMPPEDDTQAPSRSPNQPLYTVFSPTGDNEDLKHDPWNAVAVIGLKVYSHDPHVQLQIVRGEKESAEAPLDRDHPAVSATHELRYWDSIPE